MRPFWRPLLLLCVLLLSAACQDLDKERWLPTLPGLPSSSMAIAGSDVPVADYALTALGDSVLVAAARPPTPGSPGSPGYLAHPNDLSKPCPWAREGHPQRSRCVWVPPTEGTSGDSVGVQVRSLDPAILGDTREGHAVARAPGWGRVEVRTLEGQRVYLVEVRQHAASITLHHQGRDITNLRTAPGISADTITVTARAWDRRSHPIGGRRFVWTVESAAALPGAVATTVEIGAWAEPDGSRQPSADGTYTTPSGVVVTTRLQPDGSESATFTRVRPAGSGGSAL